MGLSKYLLDPRPKFNEKFVFYFFLAILNFGLSILFLWASLRIWDVMEFDPYFLEASNHEAMRWVGQAVFFTTASFILSLLCGGHLGAHFLVKAINNQSFLKFKFNEE